MILPKYPSEEASIFSVMSGLANEYKAINLSQGFPDFPVDPFLIEMVSNAMKKGFNQYAPMAGIPELQKTIAERIQKTRGIYVNPESEVTITPGATYGIFTAFTTLLQPKDEVLVLEPAYDSYIPNIYVTGGIPVTVPLDTTNFLPNWAQIQSAITRKTRAIIINNPHNPCGSIWSRSDFQSLNDLVTKHNLYVISDEVYENLVYDNHKHTSILEFPELRKRSFVIFSFGKSLHNTGWKIGYCIAPPELTTSYRRIHQYLSFSVSTPLQKGIADYLNATTSFEQSTKMLESKRNLFLKEMEDTGFICPRISQGSYFQLMDYSKISTLPDKEFAIWLTKEKGVATIPLSSFYNDSSISKTLVRFCFAKEDNTLIQAATRLKNIKSS